MGERSNGLNRGQHTSGYGAVQGAPNKKLGQDRKSNEINLVKRLHKITIYSEIVESFENN